jgi:hypothetical protein
VSDDDSLNSGRLVYWAFADLRSLFSTLESERAEAGSNTSTSAPTVLTVRIRIMSSKLKT